MIRSVPSVSLCESLSNSLAISRVERASGIQSAVPKMQSVFKPDNRVGEGEVKAYY